MGYTAKEIKSIALEEPLLHPDARPARLERPAGSRMTNLNIRMPGDELIRLARVAREMGMNPKQLARRLVTQGLDRLESHAD